VVVFPATAVAQQNNVRMQHEGICVSFRILYKHVVYIVLWLMAAAHCCCCCCWCPTHAGAIAAAPVAVAAAAHTAALGKLTSQPSLLLALQLPQPWLHAPSTQLLLLHVAAALLKEQAVPHVPQLVTEDCRLVCATAT
jgi:hypothetical protein